jgi:hypothetical protein
VDPGPFAPVVALEASWGVLFTFFVAGALLAVAWQPRSTAPAAVQLMIVAAALLIACLVGLDPGPLPVVVALALTSVLLLRLNTTARPHVLAWGIDWPMLLVSVAAAPFWFWYAVDAFANSRAEANRDEATWGINHWPVHGATALVIAAAALLACVWPHGRRLLVAATSLAGTFLGTASLAYPSSAGAMPSQAWSFIAILWSVTLGLISARAHDSHQRSSTEPWAANS